MWPFNSSIQKQTISVNRQVELLAKSLALPELTPQWKLTQSSGRVDWDGANAINEGYGASAVVYAATEKRAKLISSVPWKAKIKLSDGTLEDAPDSDLQKLIDNPNPDQSWLEVMYLLSQKVDLVGDGLLSKVRLSDQGQPVALWVLPSEDMKVRAGTDRLISEYKIDRKTTPADDMVHLKLPSPSTQMFGQPVLMAAGRAADIDREGANWQKSGLQNRGIIDVMIKVPEGTDTGVIEGIKKRWKERNASADNAREPLVTSGDVNQLGQSAAEMDFVNSRKSVWTEIAAAFGVPLASLGFTESVNLANAKEMNRMIWVDTIIPLLELYKRQLDKQLAQDFGKEYCLEYDLSNVAALQDGLDSKLANAERLIRMGYTRNEVNQRLELGFEEDESGNTRYEPMGMIPIGFGEGLEQEGDTDDEEKRRLRLVGYGKE